MTDYAGGTVAVVDRATNTAVDPGDDVGAYPFYAAVMGRRLYVVNTATNALTIVDDTGDTVMGLDVAAGSPASVPAGAAPVELLVRGDRLYVSNVNCAAVAVCDAADQYSLAKPVSVCSATSTEILPLNTSAARSACAVPCSRWSAMTPLTYDTVPLAELILP